MTTIKKTQYWLLTTEYPPQSGGGISTYCQHTVKIMTEAGMEVTVFKPERQNERIKITHDDGIRIVRYRDSSNPQDKFLGWEAALSYQCADILGEFSAREGNPDYIESQEYLGLAYYPLQRRMLHHNYLSSSKFFITAHAPSFLYLDFNQAPSFQMPEFWIGEMERSVLRSGDIVIFPSQYLIDQLRPYVSMAGVSMQVLRNPFPDKEYASAFQYGDLVYFGKLTPQKGGPEMLSYLKEMWDSGFQHRLRIIGAGEHFYYPKLMDMGDYVRKYYKSYIDNGLLSIVGHIAPENLNDHLSRAHVIIVPSIVDNLPYTVIEAMAIGKIVLASDQGGHAELIDHGKNGFLFSHTRKHSFSQALEQILALTENQREAIGRAAQLTVRQECSYDVIRKKKIELLTNMKSGRDPRQFPYIRPRRVKKPEQFKSLERNLLSVIIPVYNLGDYVKECVQSVIDAFYPDKEILVVDDGSTSPSTLKVLAEIEKLEGVRVIHQGNIGLCLTRNESAELARGEYLAFLDADDTILPHFYDWAIDVLKAYDNVSFVGCWAKYFGENDATWPTFNPEPPYLLTHNMVNSSALIYKTTHFLAAGKNDPDMVYGMEDYESIVNMVENGYQGVVIPEVLWNYRIRRGSMAQSFNYYSELYLYRMIAKKHSKFLSEYAEEIINILNANGPGIRYNNPTIRTPYRSNILFQNQRFVNLIKRNKILRKLAKKIYSLLFAYK